MEEEIYKLIMTLILTLFSIVLSYTIKHLDDALKKSKIKTMKFKNDEQRELYIHAMEDIDTIAKTTVYAIEQVIGKKLKEDINNGYANYDELKDLSTFAVDKISNTVSKRNMLILESHLGDVDEYIKDLVEHNVVKLKSDLYK